MGFTCAAKEARTRPPLEHPEHAAPPDFDHHEAGRRSRERLSTPPDGPSADRALVRVAGTEQREQGLRAMPEASSVRAGCRAWLAPRGSSQVRPAPTNQQRAGARCCAASGVPVARVAMQEIEDGAVSHMPLPREPFESEVPAHRRARTVDGRPDAMDAGLRWFHVEHIQSPS